MTFYSMFEAVGCASTPVERPTGVLASLRDSLRRGGPVSSFIRRPRARKYRFKTLQLALLASSALLVAACGGGGDEEQAAAPPNPPNPPVNQPPTISGNPATSVMQNTAYSFTPTAGDPDLGTTLTFSITNRPSWATFSTTNGALVGTPTAADVGNYQNIQITVSDGTATASLQAFNVNVVATASGAATLTWTPPTQNTDGSALTDLAGYRVYWGTAQGSYPFSKPVNGAGLTSAVVDQLTPATYFFVVTAVDNDGNESVYSNIASKTVL
jgi:hypothetical protein